MLRFFRQIRKKLMEHNKVRMYLFYAIGEIALVMIGILLALQVNNWNESRSNAIQEQVILKNLYSEIKAEQDNLIEHIKGQNIWVDDGVYILRHYDQNSGFVIDTELLKRLNDLFVRSGFIPTTTTFETLENTGNLDLIQNTVLKNELVSYYQSVSNFADNTKNNNSDLVDGLVNQKLIDLTLFQQSLFTDKSKDLIPALDMVHYEMETDEKMMKHLQDKLSDIENISKVLNMVNFRILLANVQLDFANQQLERTTDLTVMIENEMQN